MNLQSLNNVVAGIEKCAAGIFRQNCHCGVLSPRTMKPTSVRAGFFAASLGLAALSSSFSNLSAQTSYYGTNGTEYAVIGALPGDQIFPDASITTTGGILVWQDNITDGDGWGVSARRLDGTLSGTLGTFRVNVVGLGNQENPHVAMLKNGGVAFAWQGGVKGNEHIYARFLSPANTFLSGSDILVNTVTNNYQINPSLAVLNNSNIVIVWSSYRQAESNSMLDVYAQILSPTGTKVGGEFLVNQFINYNQRSAVVAAQPSGGFIVVWISEQQRAQAGTNSAPTLASGISAPSVDVYARQFTSAGLPVANEYLVNSDLKPCANPAVAVATDGSLLVAWGARDTAYPTNSLDVYARAYSSGGSGGSVLRVNTRVYGDEYAPHISAIGFDFLVTWTSLGQDGSREGVYGQFVHNDGTKTGGEFRVNTTTSSQQMDPCVASDGVNQFLVFWTGFTGLQNGFDLYAQRYLNTSALLQAMSAPYVWAPFVVSNNVYQPRLVVSWAPLLGLSISNYSVYVDGSASASGVVTTNQWTMTVANGLTTNSTHAFNVDYLMTDGRRAPISPSTSGTTWSGLNWGGIPYEWMATYFGGYYNGNYNTNFWPTATTRMVAGGPTLNQIFVSGGNPYDSGSWLKQSLTKTAQGMFLSWNTQSGAMYQVQISTNVNSWNNLGSPRFAAGTNDSIYVGGSPVGYYRIVLLR